MKISLNWLKTYVPFDLTAEDMADRLTMIGLEVEEINTFESPYKRIVVGKTVTLDDHPSSEKLKICRVDVGSSQKMVVCGAPNIAKDLFVPVALEGAELEGEKVRSTRIRGIQSEAVICSERELGVSDDHSGVLILGGPSYRPGQFLFPDASADDAVLDVNVTPNRPDCLSHLGIAREVACLLGTSVDPPDTDVLESDIVAGDLVHVHIENEQSCPRYSARVIQNVRIAPSPPWMKVRLEAVGIRSINNVVDATNFTLMETGHPLHAFDLDLVQGNEIIIRHAAEGELFVTLDGVERRLKDGDLLICDKDRPVALAGVMGGLNSEVSGSTHDILLESAYFSPTVIRRTAKRLGLSTEASQRFERGADPNGTLKAADRCSVLMQNLADASVCRGIVDAYPTPILPRRIPLRHDRIRHILGSDIPPDSVTTILSGLDLQVDESNDPITVMIPTFRPDLEREIDLIEEVMRHHGYEKIEPRSWSVVPLSHTHNEMLDFSERLKDRIVGMGFQETVSNSMVPESHIRCLYPDTPFLRVTNPINPGTSCLRMSLITSLLDAVQWNQNRSTSNVRFFEIGRVFHPKKKTLPDERSMLCGVMAGAVRSEPYWAEPEKSLNWYHLRGVVESLLRSFSLFRWDFKEGTHPAFRPETSLVLKQGKKQFGSLGEISSSLREAWDIETPVFGFEFFMDTLHNILPKTKKALPIPRFPSIKRDLAVVVSEEIPVNELRTFLVQHGGKMLSDVSIFDVYQGRQIPSGKKSVAFSLAFSVPDRTLKEEEVDPIFHTLLEGLQSSFAAELRS